MFFSKTHLHAHTGALVEFYGQITEYSRTLGNINICTWSLFSNSQGSYCNWCWIRAFNLSVKKYVILGKSSCKIDYFSMLTKGSATNGVDNIIFQSNFPVWKFNYNEMEIFHYGILILICLFAGFNFLDAGSIIGIVVGLLVIILAFIIIGYSRRTGRLCFAGEFEALLYK